MSSILGRGFFLCFLQICAKSFGKAWGEMMKGIGNLNIGRSWGIGREKGFLVLTCTPCKWDGSYLHLVV